MSTPGTLRDALALALAVDAGESHTPEKYNYPADAVLASDEMQAIRSYIEWTAHRHELLPGEWLRRNSFLPESVIRWVDPT